MDPRPSIWDLQLSPGRAPFPVFIVFGPGYPPLLYTPLYPVSHYYRAGCCLYPPDRGKRIG